MRRLLWLLGVLLLVGPVAPEAKAESQVVEVRNNVFVQARIRIEPGDSVRWSVVDSGHTMTSDDGSFEFPADAAFGQTVNAGEEYEATFPKAGVYYYHCRIHGIAGNYPIGMTGAIYVGVPFEGPAGELRRVPDEYPTVAAAFVGIPPGSTVSLAPGVYHDVPRILAKDLTLRGEGASPSDVVIVGGNDVPTVVEAAAHGIAIENLSVRGGQFESVLVNGAKSFTVRDVWVEGSLTGIHLRNASSGTVSGVRVTDASQVGILVEACDPCGTLIAESSVTGAGVGLLVNSALGVVVRDVTMVDNDVGIQILNGRGVDVLASSVAGGNVGIRVDTNGMPAIDVRVFDNQVTGYTAQGLQWDLIGLRVCFSGNVDPARDGVPASQPPMLQSLFPCSAH